LTFTDTQKFNRRHHESGHLFQGRYKAILVQKDSHLLELTRYVVLNPVRAGMVRRLEDWAWSSYNATSSAELESRWLDVDWTLSQFGKDRTTAYRQFVIEGKGLPDPKAQVSHQMFLGNDAFIAEHQQASSDYQRRYSQRDEAMAKAYISGVYTMGGNRSAF
jgi:hypothetical protein